MAQPHDPKQLELVLKVALGLSALLLLGAGVYFLVVREEQLIGLVLLGVGAGEAVLAQFLPAIISKRAASSRR